MKDWRKGFSVVVSLAVLAGSGNALAFGGHHRGHHQMYQVTVTNITQGEIFTPIMVAAHPRAVKLFELGTVASAELEMLAESGNSEPLALLLKSAGALDVVTAEDVLPPGESVTLTVEMNGRNRHVSVAAMLVPTNDAFVAVNGVEGPKGHGTLTLLSPAYDAGTEDNDEMCTSIPGPPFICSGEGFDPAGGEGYVYIHPGISGVGDLVAADHDWRNPVARIRIRAARRSKPD